MPDDLRCKVVELTQGDIQITTRVTSRLYSRQKKTDVCMLTFMINNKMEVSAMNKATQQNHTLWQTVTVTWVTWIKETEWLIANQSAGGLGNG